MKFCQVVRPTEYKSVELGKGDIYKKITTRETFKNHPGFGSDLVYNEDRIE